MKTNDVPPLGGGGGGDDKNDNESINKSRNSTHFKIEVDQLRFKVKAGNQRLYSLANTTRKTALNEGAIKNYFES